MRVGKFEVFNLVKMMIIESRSSTWPLNTLQDIRSLIGWKQIIAGKSISK